MNLAALQTQVPDLLPPLLSQSTIAWYELRQTIDGGRAGFKASDSFWMRAFRLDDAVFAESNGTVWLQPGMMIVEALIR